MGSDALTKEFRRRLDEMHLMLESPESEADRFVFDLAGGQIVIDPHPTQTRQVLLLAEAVCSKGQGEALELARLVAKRDHLEHPGAHPHIVVWRDADHTSARFNQEDWVRFEDWIHDQFLLEDAIAKMDEGVPV